jgi:hypothetical protein
MDYGWIRTYGSNSKMAVQISVASEGGSGTPVPDLSIEVNKIETVLTRVKKAGIPIEYGPKSEPWGVRRFFVRDPFGKLINILPHNNLDAIFFLIGLPTYSVESPAVSLYLSKRSIM